MTKVRLVFVIALSVFSSQAFGQDAMKKRRQAMDRFGKSTVGR